MIYGDKFKLGIVRVRSVSIQSRRPAKSSLERGAKSVGSRPCRAQPMDDLALSKLKGEFGAHAIPITIYCASGIATGLPGSWAVMPRQVFR